MIGKDISLDIFKSFGLKHSHAWLMKTIVDHNPNSQEDLRDRYNDIMVSIDKKNKTLTKSGCSKACNNLIKRGFIKPNKMVHNNIKYDINEETFERIRKGTRFIEIDRLEKMLNKIPEFIPSDQEELDANEFFKKERELYNSQKWWEARKSLLSYNKKNLSLMQESVRQRLLGWINYYIGKKETKEPGQTVKTDRDRIRIAGPKLRGIEARDSFIQVLRLSKSKDDVNSALSGLPLVYYFLGRESEKAFKVVEKAKEIAWNKAPIYNTEAILKREEKLYIDALKAFSKSYKEAEKVKDYRTCGNATNNIARISMNLLFQLVKLKLHGQFMFNVEMLRKLKDEVMNKFDEAVEQYKLNEKISGISALFHIEGIEKQKKILEDNIEIKSLFRD